MEKLQSFLNSINAILRVEKVKKEESTQRGERFNVFQICGVDHYEILHSAIIASFLDSKGSHGQGDKFLKSFLQTIDDKTGIDTPSCSVYKEYITNEGRIDILIEDKKSHGIIIENKIYAADQYEQLKRYDNYSKTKYGDGNYVIYYLTLDKHDARDYSAKGVNYKGISYEIHIKKWIEECIKESATTPLIRETLIQYRNHIKQLTSQDMETTNKEELLETMAKNSEIVTFLFAHQEDYKKYVFSKYVIESPVIKDLCLKKELKIGLCKMFEGCTSHGFYFYKQEWKSAAIWFFTDRSGEWDFYWGISNYKEELKVEEQIIDCLSKKPNKHWPYGWEYLSKYRNWDWNTYTEMTKGNVAQYIKDLVLLALHEIEKKGLKMP